MLKLMLILYIW